MRELHTIQLRVFSNNSRNLPSLQYALESVVGGKIGIRTVDTEPLFNLNRNSIEKLVVLDRVVLLSISRSCFSAATKP